MTRNYHTDTLQRKSHRTITITRHHENKQSKATSSLFPIAMIAKLEIHTKQCTLKHVINTEPFNGSNNLQQQNCHLE